MKTETTPLSGLLVIQPTLYRDNRGYFYEGFHQKRYAESTIPPMVQMNLSHSTKNVLRGLHYQLPNAQGKLVSVIQGRIFDVAVDIRSSSPTFGKHFSIVLDDEKHAALYIPPGFAHGFCVLSDTADVMYQCTDFYAKESERGIMWNDTTLNIPWPIKDPILSEKDQIYPTFDELTHIYA
jgi:dTDP-4-dehydrorhamnose 3,5-epimerase